MDENLPEDDSDYDVEFLPHSVTGKMEDIAYGLHIKGQAYINHYSRIKRQYRTLALTWVTSFFIALAYILSGTEQGIHVNKLYVIIALSVAAVIGIKLLRYLDVGIYHPQMRALYICLTDLEAKHSNLCRPFQKMSLVLHSRGFDPVIIDNIYYGLFSLIVSGLGLFALGYSFEANHHPYEAIVVPSFIFAGFVVWEVFNTVKTFIVETNSYKKESEKGSVPHNLWDK